jgi:magnesium-transporting ATPase (P-type)
MNLRNIGFIIIAIILAVILFTVFLALLPVIIILVIAFIIYLILRFRYGIIFKKEKKEKKVKKDRIDIQSQNRLRFYSICGIIPVYLFGVWFVIATILSPGYSGAGNYISPGSVGPLAMLQNIVFIVLGLLSIGLALGLRDGLPSPQNRLLKIGVWSVIIFGLGVLLAGLLPLVGLLPENYLARVPYNLVSTTAFAVTIGAYIASLLLIGQGLKNEDSVSWGKYRKYSFRSGLLFIILVILLTLAILYTGYPGVSLRAFLILLWASILITGLKLYSPKTIMTRKMVN